MSRASIVASFIESARSGDIEAFTRTLIAVNWTGAWRDLLTAAVAIKSVHPDIQVVFRAAWHGWPNHPADMPIIAGRNRWNLSRDLDGSLDLLVVMKRLLPPSDDRAAPLALYRGESVAEHEAGAHGVWWTPCPVYSEFYARDPRRAAARGGVVVAAFAPDDAIVCSLSPVEYLVDSRKLADVVTVTKLSPYTDEDLGADTLYASHLMGLPSGWDAAGIDQWLALDRPTDGLPSCRFRREIESFRLVMAA